MYWSMTHNVKILRWLGVGEDGLIISLEIKTRSIECSSPMIFVMAAEILTQLLLRGQAAGLINGFRMSRQSAEIPALQYADDTLIFINAERNQVSNLNAILTLFEAFTGLKINRKKSCIFPIGNVENIQELAGILNCSTGNLPCKYLGLPLGDSHTAPSAWQDMKEKIEERLSVWSSKFISKGGRMVLIKSTLLGLPTHLMSLLPIPAHVADDLEKTMARFFWGSTDSKRKLHCVAWNFLCQPKENGGLGFRRLKDINKALLAKWHDRFLKEPNDRLWKRAIIDKYGVSDSGWRTVRDGGAYGCSRWRFLARNSDDYFRNTKVSVGDGNKADFWSDRWTDIGPLKQQFSNLHQVAVRKSGPVASFTSTENDQTAWKIDCRRRLTDTEIQEFVSFSDQVTIPTLNSAEDEMNWIYEDHPTAYSVRKQVMLYQKSRRDDPAFTVFIVPWLEVWNSSAPLKIQYLLWTITVGRILTTVRLRRLGHVICSRCVMCKADEESDMHLFFHCQVSQQVWFGLREGFLASHWDTTTSVTALSTWKARHLTEAGKSGT